MSTTTPFALISLAVDTQLTQTTMNVYQSWDSRLSVFEPWVKQHHCICDSWNGNVSWCCEKFGHLVRNDVRSNELQWHYQLLTGRAKNKCATQHLTRTRFNPNREYYLLHFCLQTLLVEWLMLNYLEYTSPQPRLISWTFANHFPDKNIKLNQHEKVSVKRAWGFESAAPWTHPTAVWQHLL
jgi:hypothetical protein